MIVVNRSNCDNMGVYGTISHHHHHHQVMLRMRYLTAKSHVDDRSTVTKSVTSATIKRLLPKLRRIPLHSHPIRPASHTFAFTKRRPRKGKDSSVQHLSFRGRTESRNHIGYPSKKTKAPKSYPASAIHPTPQDDDASDPHISHSPTT